MKPDRSPLKDKPLRHPGQSLEEERHRLWDEKIEPWLLMALFLVAVAALEWFRAWRMLPPTPWLFTGVAALGVCLAAWRLVHLRPRLRALRQGIEGEKAVGQFLDGLRANGYRTFHDVLGAGFNIDHVLVGPAGVLTIETKTWSKPARGDARITFDGLELRAADRLPDRDPVRQARAQAAWLANLLKESTGRRYRVRPVVLFPGWFVEQATATRHRVWLLEPKALPAFLKNEPRQLSVEQVSMAAFHLARFIRSVEREGGGRPSA